MELWVTEPQTEDLRLSFRVKEILRREQTPYQELVIADTEAYGRLMLLDGFVQLTEKDEFVYHEMLAHVPLAAHPKPERVLIVGGGDGGTLREVLQHQVVREAHLAEIDGAVLQASRDFFPTVSVALDHPRAHVEVADGIAYVAAHLSYFDVILVDSSEPIGAGQGLFTEDFYASCARALRPGGILVVQSESPFLNGDILRGCVLHMRPSFPVVQPYLASVPTYPSGTWSFTLGSLGGEPSVARADLDIDTRYYEPACQEAYFQVPPFVRELCR